MTDRAEVVKALLADPTRAAEVSRDEAEALAVGLAAVVKALEIRAVRPEPVVPVAKKPDLVGLDVISKRSGKTRRWLYDHWREIPGAKKVGRDVKILESDLDVWLGR